MKAAERRAEILKILCRRRYETISVLAAEFNVSERTIRRDIESLIMNIAKKYLPTYARPHHVEIVKEIEKNATGKTIRRRLL